VSGWLPVAWAEKAPVADVYERVILTLMAHRARPDGTGCYPSIKTMAEFAMCEETSIKRRLTSLRNRLVIAYGDQAIAMHIDARYRPKVYDLLIPVSWYSASQLDGVNRDRAERGLPPMTAENRPNLMPPPARKRRADTGTVRRSNVRPIRSTG